jgi:hypothetical protein
MPTVPGQMFTHTLNPVKGWPNPAALDYRAKVSANVLYDMFAGQACHLNSAGQYEPGVIGQQMGMFIFQGVNELDVNNAQSPGQWIPLNPSGNVMSIVAKSPVELETTEFDATQTYTPNQPLRAPTGNGSSAYASGSGQLTNQSWVFGTNAYCGLVTGRGVFKNSYQQSVISFWPVYQPVSANS